MRRLLVTGSSGLIGSEVVAYFSAQGWEIHGIDNNMRAEFFGPGGDTKWNLNRLRRTTGNFHHHDADIRDREKMVDIFKMTKPAAVVHAAAQPSHDLAAQRPFDDFSVNAQGTLNLLEAHRKHCPQSPFVYMSTNKVYGDAPNELPLVETDTRWDFATDADRQGIDESFRVDQTKHSLFGVSKLAADLMVQEYGRYFSIPTCCLRGGCLTGPHHSGVELHGFLSYLIRCNLEGRCYRIYGYKGKQVRDNIHAFDVARFIEAFIAAPRTAEVYNIGGGRENSVSILEAFRLIEEISGKPMLFTYSETNRIGDHICYYSNLSKARRHYPEWSITIDLAAIFKGIHDAMAQR